MRPSLLGAKQRRFVPKIMCSSAPAQGPVALTFAPVRSFWLDGYEQSGPVIGYFAIHANRYGTLRITVADLRRETSPLIWWDNVKLKAHLARFSGKGLADFNSHFGKLIGVKV